MAAGDAEILARLREVLGEDAPAALRFTPGRVPDPVSEDPAQALPPVPAPTAADRAEGEKLAAAIEDPELRDLVARAAAASLATARDGRSI